MNAPVAARDALLVLPQHAPAAEYKAFVQQYTSYQPYRWNLDKGRRVFIEQYPDMRHWFQAPLLERVGMVAGRPTGPLSAARMYQAHIYLLFLGLYGYIQLDWAWLVAVRPLNLARLFASQNWDAGLADLIRAAIGLGYSQERAEEQLTWIVNRLLLHHSQHQVTSITQPQIDECAQALTQFEQRPDIALFYGSPAGYHQVLHKSHLSALHLLQLVLYERGQLPALYQRTLPQRAVGPVPQPQMAAVIARYLAERRLTDRPRTVCGAEQALHRLAEWLAATYPQVTSFAHLTREQILEFAADLNTRISAQTQQPLSIGYKRLILARLAQFFRYVLIWESPEVPRRPLLLVQDLPKRPQRIPRYIPQAELDRLMAAIRTLECPLQRAALLIARWSGARRDEIRHLTIDCLDNYPNGQPRLRIPAGKTYQERLVPLAEEAATAIRTVLGQRSAQRGLLDLRTGQETHYLFMRHGRLVSYHYLFETALEHACAQAGLVTGEGKPTISAHRFRHTLATQLAERGARVRTIMRVLGHSSAEMSMIYAYISDPEVLADYQGVLGPDQPITGPFAETLRSSRLAASDLDWLQANFFKTALELGHCLRLPQEGPCECELYLNCAKFVTSREYAPRLRRRRKLEFQLIEDAQARGWAREVERHRCVVEKIEQYLRELGEPLEGPEASD